MSTQKRKQFILTPAEDLALAKLVAADYPFPATTQTGVIKKMLHEVWAVVFPNQPFPTDEEAMCYATESS